MRSSDCRAAESLCSKYLCSVVSLLGVCDVIAVGSYTFDKASKALTGTNVKVRLGHLTARDSVKLKFSQCFKLFRRSL